jgi:hypothetical protein
LFQNHPADAAEGKEEEPGDEDDRPQGTHRGDAFRNGGR